MSRIKCLSCKALLVQEGCLEGSLYTCKLQFPLTFYWTARDVVGVRPTAVHYGCKKPYKTQIAVKAALKCPSKLYRYRWRQKDA